VLVRAVRAVVPRRRGGELPDRTVRRSVTVDRGRLAAYDRVCGFRLRDELPPTYPHVLAFPLAIELMTELPFGVLGLVHVGNRIEALRPIRADERLDLLVRAADMAAHERGTQFDVVTEAAVGDEPVWRERSTYLRRERSGGPRLSDRSSPPPASAVWTVPGDVGRRYARVSGDWNPIHLSGLTARVLGQQGAIAHGMWTLARCLAAFEGSLGEAFEVEVRFKRPVLLGGRVGFWARGGAFGVWDLHSGAPCLTGKAHLGGESGAVRRHD
jgi:MaoC like domain